MVILQKKIVPIGDFQSHVLLEIRRHFQRFLNNKKLFKMKSKKIIQCLKRIISLLTIHNR